MTSPSAPAGSSTAPALRQATNRSGRTSTQPGSATSRNLVQVPSTSLCSCPSATRNGRISTPNSSETIAAASSQAAPSAPVIRVKRSYAPRSRVEMSWVSRPSQAWGSAAPGCVVGW